LRHSRVLLAASVAVILWTCFCGGALAVQTASLEVSFSPERLGAPTTIFFAFRISSIPPASQTPLTNVSVLLPSEMGLATSGLGLENCVVARLEERGAEGCPPNALMGRGTATAEIAIGGEAVAESAQIEVFSAPVQNGRLGLLVYANAESPVNAQLVFPASVVPARPPYGESIDANVPLVPSVLGAPDVAVTRFHMALGSTDRGAGHFVYYRWVRGVRVAYSPSGLLLPPSCPRGGFPFKAQFVFQDQTEATALATVSCPRRSRRLRSR
jgi:hypothetical protein